MSETLYRIEVGRRLRAAIEAKGLTQTDVVGTLDGVSASKLNNWLRGDHYPSAWFVKQFCDRYGITTDWIYRGIVSGMDSALADALWKSERTDPRPVPPAVKAKRRPKDTDPPPFHMVGALNENPVRDSAGCPPTVRALRR